MLYFGINIQQHFVYMMSMLILFPSSTVLAHYNLCSKLIKVSVYIMKPSLVKDWTALQC